MTRFIAAILAGAVVLIGIGTVVLAIHATAALLLAAIKTLSVWG